MTPDDIRLAADTALAQIVRPAKAAPDHPLARIAGDLKRMQTAQHRADGDERRADPLPAGAA